MSAAQLMACHPVNSLDFWQQHQWLDILATHQLFSPENGDAMLPRKLSSGFGKEKKGLRDQAPACEVSTSTTHKPRTGFENI